MFQIFRVAIKLMVSTSHINLQNGKMNTVYSSPRENNSMGSLDVSNNSTIQK